MALDPERLPPDALHSVLPDGVLPSFAIETDYSRDLTLVTRDQPHVPEGPPGRGISTLAELAEAPPGRIRDIASLLTLGERPERERLARSSARAGSTHRRAF